MNEEYSSIDKMGTKQMKEVAMATFLSQVGKFPLPTTHIYQIFKSDPQISNSKLRLKSNMESSKNDYDSLIRFPIYTLSWWDRVDLYRPHSLIHTTCFDLLLFLFKLQQINPHDFMIDYISNVSLRLHINQLIPYNTTNISIY